jgi:acyl-CoA synthetase (AMP-forming)/AMP-acid ligase II
LEGYPCIIIKSQDFVSHDEVVIDFAGNSALPSLPITSTREAEQIQLVLFTSGTTGTPKGVCLSQSNILAAAWMMVDFLSLEVNRRSLVTVPLYDYYGLIQIFGHVLAGASFVFGENIALPGGLFKRIANDQITDLVLVPYTLRQMLQIIGDQGQHIMQKLEVITSSSDVLSDDILGRTFELNPRLRIFNIYGLTEAGRACYREITATTPSSKSIGRPSRGVEVQIDGNRDEPGEIVLRGPNVMEGYLQEVPSDRIAFLPCKEVRTGDLGYFDENGEIVLLGRSDHMMNLMGVKIHPNEIESIALGISGVQEAFAYVSVNLQGAPSVSLDVVLSDKRGDTNTIFTHMRNGLPRMFVPATINVVSQIRRTELGGKILRKRVHP